MPPAYLKAGEPDGIQDRYRNGCTGKVRFASPALAAEVARTRRGRGPNGNGDTRTRDAYRCPACGGWHLGTMPKADKRVHGK